MDSVSFFFSLLFKGNNLISVGTCKVININVPIDIIKI